jgi:hypothetical protein
VQNEGLAGIKFRNETISADHIGQDLVSERNFADGAVEANDFMSNTLTSRALSEEAQKAMSNVGDFTIGYWEVVDDSVDGAIKIEMGSLTSSVFAPEKLGPGSFADNSISGVGLARDSVTTDKIADGAVVADKFSANTITPELYAAETIITSNFADGAVGNDNLKLGVITSSKFAEKTLTTDNLADKAVETNHIVDGSISSVQVASGAVEGKHLKNLQIQDSHFSNGSLPGMVEGDVMSGASAVYVLKNHTITFDKFNGEVFSQIQRNVKILGKIKDRLSRLNTACLDFNNAETLDLLTQLQTLGVTEFEDKDVMMQQFDFAIQNAIDDMSSSLERATMRQQGKDPGPVRKKSFLAQAKTTAESPLATGAPQRKRICKRRRGDGTTSSSNRRYSLSPVLLASIAVSCALVIPQTLFRLLGVL